MTLYLSRLELKSDPGTNALKALINPAEQGRALDAHHRLLWSLFADGPERRRDFLWRAEDRGRFFTLSRRPPRDGDLFKSPEVKVFEPDLKAGDRLSFVLRTNATRALKSSDGSRGKRADVVMHMLHTTPGKETLPEDRPSARPAERMTLARVAAWDWMEKQGLRHGFSPVDIGVEDYSVRALPLYRGPRKGQPQFGILDLTGVIEVTDADALAVALGQGLGRAKAFGCGLMMIRRHSIAS